MRKSKQEAARTRDHIIEVAAQEFRRKGIAGTSLADVMAAAGLTHGGFYRHFASKDQLIAEACAAAVRAGEKTASTLLCPYKGDDLEAFAENYLSAGHRDDPSGGCLLAALGSELARADEQTRRVATEGLLMLADRLAAQFSGVRPQIAKQRALVALATLVGALILARMVTDPKLSSRILREATKHVSTLVS